MRVPGRQNRIESKVTILSTPATVPVTIRHLRGEDYLIQTKAPSYIERTDTHTKRADSEACSLKSGESSETDSFEVPEYNLLLPDTAIRIESLTGGLPSRRLDGELRTSTALTGGKQTTHTTWDLTRER